MQQIRNFDEANERLAKYIPAARLITGKDITLVRMKPLMEKLGNPERKLKIIHVAGTSGKSSTCYYIAALLQATGIKVGLTVSPHVSCINERVQVNLEPLPENSFATALEEFLELIEGLEPEPTYFELLVAFAYWYFVRIGVDYAVIETGLGGLHDATNVANRPDKVCVITDIGYDHMNILGNTLVDIANQKAGIIHPSNQTFMFAQSAQINDVIQEYADEQKALLNVLSNIDVEIKPASDTSLKALPAFQQRNWLLAKQVFLYVASRDGIPALTAAQLNATMSVHVPGRMDVRKVGDKTIILDGAHNEQKMQAFVGSFKQLYPGKTAAILLGLKEGKEYEAVLPLIKPICSQVIMTSFVTAQDVPITAIAPEILAKAAKKIGFDEVIIEPDCRKAYQKLLAAKSEMCIVTGSFYLLGSILPYMDKV